MDLALEGLVLYIQLVGALRRFLKIHESSPRKSLELGHVPTWEIDMFRHRKEWEPRGQVPGTGRAEPQIPGSEQRAASTAWTSSAFAASAGQNV